ncbi:MAG TPA: M6 family metalloprotease domain-containing protein [Longimicrobiales bacterium]
MVAVAALCVLPAGARAQLPRPLPDAGTGAMPPASIVGLQDAQPYAPMEFSRAWLGKVEQVRRRRQELLAAGELDGLSPDSAARLGAALTGTLRVLVVPILYGDEAPPFPVTSLADRLFGPAHGDTVSYASYFDEVSSGLLHVTGNVTSWIRLAHPAGYYLPKEQYGWGRFGRVKEVREEALRQVEASVDLGQFDNDGPDGVPNSGDDDGYADFVIFVYAVPCGAGTDTRSGAIWPHRGAMKPFQTHTPSKSGGFEKVADYLILPAVDPRSCGPLQVGVLAHETGHALGLPDLYDYAGTSQGIGAWGLMGTGSHSAPWSPAHLSAWSKEQLGWVKEVWLRHDTTGLAFPAVETSHTVFRYDLPGTDGEYLLLENRQQIGSDKALPGEGLLAWHVDPERGELGMWNSDERRPALAVLRAAGALDPLRPHLADGDDPFPGRSHRHSFDYLRPAGFRLSQISEKAGLVRADVHVGSALAATSRHGLPAVVRLAAAEGAAPVGQVLRVASAPANQWAAAGTAPWLHAHRDGDALVVSADPAALAPGAYADTVSLSAPNDSSFARKIVVALEVAAPGGAEVVATGLPWSWGLAARNGRMLQAGYGWDPLGLRPRPRVLALDRDDPFPHTLVRIPSDALYAPVVTARGDAYVVARADHANLLYRVDDDGSASFVARMSAPPAYGAAALPDGSLLVADWSGTIQRVSAEGKLAHFASVPDHLYQIATDSSGDVVAAGYEGDVVRIAANGHASVLATGFGRGRLVAVAAAPCGDVYAAERGGSGRIVRFGKDGKAEWTISIPGAQFYGLTVDGGFLYALDLGHHQLLRIPLSGCIPPAGTTVTAMAHSGAR